MNQTILIGRLANDPELKFTPSGVAVSNFRLAVKREYKNAEGNYDADFIDIVAWRQNAEFVGNHVVKGDQVAVRGGIQVRTYQAQDGGNRRVTEVVAEQVNLLSKKNQNGSQGNGGERELAGVAAGTSGGYDDPFQPDDLQ